MTDDTTPATADSDRLNDPRTALADVNLRTLGNRIRALRKAHGLHQRDLADGIVSVPYISRIEAGERRPHITIIEGLAERLDIPLMTLLAPDDEDDRRAARRYLARHGIDLEDVLRASHPDDTAASPRDDTAVSRPDDTPPCG